MWTRLIERYGAAVPRYTSYPTAPHFHGGVNAVTYRRWLASIGAQETLSLYLHVPFCSRLCWFCGCHTKIVQRYEPIAGYCNSLAGEIGLVADALSADPLVCHLHWGGGTPSLLVPPDFQALMTTLRRRFRFAPDAEVAIEIDPRGLTQARIEGLAAAGVTRASLGVQDFNEAVQRAINRVQPFAVVAEAVSGLRHAGIAAINFDLMYGLPKQRTDDVVRSVDLAVTLAPDRVALFGYAHVPWMKKHQRLIDGAALPDALQRLEQSEAAAERLAAHGYRRIGLDHFAKAEDPLCEALASGGLHRNFQGYTADRAGTLLGFGASAIGSLAQGYVQNAVPLRAYRDAIRGGCLAAVKGIRLSRDDRLRRAVIERLMCDLSVDLDQVGGAYGATAADFADEIAALAPMIEDGLIEIEGAQIRVREAGRPFVRTVSATFDRYLERAAARHSQAV